MYLCAHCNDEHWIRCIGKCRYGRIEKSLHRHIYRRQTVGGSVSKTPAGAETLKRQADAVAHIFNEVLKTEKQLVPKQCHYLAVYGFENANRETLEKACNNLRLATLANMDRKTMKIYIAGSERTAALFNAALQKTPMDKQRIILLPAGTLREAAQKITAEVIKDNAAGLYRRIMLFTAATNARIGYASFTAALGGNPQHFILDNFSTLDISRKELDAPSSTERKAAFEALLPNHS